MGNPEWQEPGPRARGGTDYADAYGPYVDKLKANPNQWALFKTLSYVPTGGVYDWLKKQGLEVTTRTTGDLDGKPAVKVYVRAKAPTATADA